MLNIKQVGIEENKKLTNSDCGNGKVDSLVFIFSLDSLQKSFFIGNC